MGIGSSGSVLVLQCFPVLIHVYDALIRISIGLYIYELFLYAGMAVTSSIAE